MAPPCWPGRRGWCASWPAARNEWPCSRSAREPCALPGNVAMETVPRPGRAGAIGRRAAALGAAWRLARRERVDAVFVHMAHRQAYRLWPVFRLLRLPVLLWYAHGAVTWHLRLAHRSVDRVISSSPEGFRLRSARAHFIGQGVDTQLFSLRPPAAARPHLLAVGRISRRKRLDLLVSMMAHLRGRRAHAAHRRSHLDRRRRRLRGRAPARRGRRAPARRVPRPRAHGPAAPSLRHGGRSRST